MPEDIRSYIESLIDTPSKARAVKNYLAQVDPNTLGPEDRQGYNVAQQALGRWINPAPTNPNADIYLNPRTPGDVIEGQISRPPVVEPRSGDIKDTDPTIGQHLGAAGKGLADLVGIPTSGEEWKREFSPTSLASKAMFGPFYPLVQQFSGTQQKIDQGGSLGAEDIPVVGPMVVEPARNIYRPIRAVAEGHAPTPEESLAATRSGTTAAAALALTPRSAKRASYGGKNLVLDPVRTSAREIARAETTVPKITSKIRRKHTESYAPRAFEAAEVADTLAKDVRPTVEALPFGSQGRARKAMDMSDAAVGTAKGARSMGKAERTFERNAPDQINRRLELVVDDMPSRLARGDNPGKEALTRYRDEGLPSNPDIVKADKIKVHEQTQARLSEPDMQSIVVPEDALINSIFGESMKKAHAVVGDNPKSNIHLREIVERSNENGYIDMADYKVLRDMTDGNYITGTKKDGSPVFGTVEMPEMLSDTVGYIERLRRENSGRLPSTPLEINQAKANRYDEIPDRTFESNFSDAEKTMHSIRRGQAMGLRRLVDEVTAGPDGRSQITELNRSYANLSTLETGLRNYEISDRLDAPLPPMAMAGGGSSTTPSGLLRIATGTGLLAAVTRPVRRFLTSPQTGINFARAAEALAKARGIKRPPPIPGAQPPPPGGNIPKPPTGPMGARPAGSGPGPRVPPRTGPASKPPAPAPAPQPTPQPAPAPAPQPTPQPAPAPAPQPTPQPAPATTQTPLSKQAFALARMGKIKSLKTLWDQNRTVLEKEMRPSDVRWIKEKLNRYEKNKAASVAKKAAKSTTKPQAAPTGTPATAKKTKVTKPPQAQAAPATPAPAPQPAPAAKVTAPPPDPFGMDRIKGDWRQVKTLEQTQPKPAPRPEPERPSGVVAADDWYFDDLSRVSIEKKIEELEVVHRNAVKRSNKDLADRTTRMLDDAKRVKTDRENGILPTARPEPKPADDPLAAFEETDAELAAIEAETGLEPDTTNAVLSKPPVTRESIQAMLNEAARLSKSRKAADRARAEELIDEATKLVDELESQ